MNILFQILSLISIPIFCLAQKTTVSSIPSGLIVKNKLVDANYIISKKNYNEKDYLMAVSPGYVTQLCSLDSIMLAETSDYKIKLIPLRALEYEKVNKRIVFSGFLDKNNKINIVALNHVYGQQHLNLTTNEYRNVINSKLIENKFKVLEEDDILNNKKNTADYALAGEILYYLIDTKGTPGFITSVYVKWTFYDIKNETTICKIITGGYSDTGEKIKETEALKLALKDALSGIIANNAIRKYVYDNDELNSNVPSQDITIQKISTDLTSNNFIQNAIQSSITIKTKSGHGSGFLISSNGYILTNFHVIEDSSNIQGILQNGITLPLKLIAFDKKADVALCKMPGKGYKPLAIDTISLENKIGSDCVAIGTPEKIELGQTVTKGIISGLREFNDFFYIQTDVSINAGNSGGMLINKNGEVIGIVSAKIKGLGVEGLGFAIPIANALKYLNIKIKDNK